MLNIDIDIDRLVWRGGAVIGEKELSRDGCLGVGQGGVWRGVTTVGVEGWSSDRCGGIEEG